MEIINLPGDLKIKNNSVFKFYDYQTSKESLKQMVSLQQNTFSFLLEGTKEVFSKTKSTSIENNSFLLMKKGNCLMTERVPNNTNNYRSILFFFSDEILISFIQKHKIKRHKQQKEFLHPFEYDQFLQVFVNGLISISKLDTQIQPKLLALKFEELILYLTTIKGTNFIFSLLENINLETNHFIEVIETNKFNKLTLNELSFLSNMSLSKFKREFEKHFHSSPSKWFQEKRLEKAAFLLKNTSKKPSDIFEEIGYENLSNFIQAFKIKYGKTPKQYQLD